VYVTLQTGKLSCILYQLLNSNKCEGTKNKDNSDKNELNKNKLIDYLIKRYLFFVDIMTDKRFLQSLLYFYKNVSDYNVLSELIIVVHYCMIKNKFIVADQKAEVRIFD
jgi:hypothetical protein